MSALLLSFLGLSVGIPHCPMWKEIAPCQCRMYGQLTTIQCDKMQSVQQIISLLQGHFSPADRVSLKITSSTLDDLPHRTFAELNMTIVNLSLNHNNLGELHDTSFEGLNKVLLFSLADNFLYQVPDHIWPKVAAVRTIDIGRTRISSLSKSNFKGLPQLKYLVVSGNVITHMDQDTFPVHLQRLQIGRNSIKSLNRTLAGLNDLIWLFAGANELEDLEGELPANAPKLLLIHFSHNKIKRLPSEFLTLSALETLFFEHNELTSLDGCIGKLRKLKRVVFDHNKIERLTSDDFAETIALESLMLSNNRIQTLNNSLTNLRNLKYLNLSTNLLTEFSLQEVSGLEKLLTIDISHNKIKTITGPATNLVDWNMKLSALRLDHNDIEHLNGALSGLSELVTLNLSFNKLSNIQPDDLLGLDKLRLLDVSHNFISTFEHTSKAFLPNLEELRAAYNFLTILDKDFLGMPVLCHADLSNNQIVALSRDLVSKTRCKISYGIHEGSWDTLKIYLQDNPILCDSALPEISSTMETQHARIYGVAHCAPLSEQPVTSKPNSFLGYIPAIAVESILVNNTSSPNDLKIEAVQPLVPATAYERPQTEQHEAPSPSATAGGEMIVVIKQEQQLSKLASEIEELRTRVDELASQNQLLLSHQFGVPNAESNDNVNSSNTNHTISSTQSVLTVIDEVSQSSIDDIRKP